MLLMSMCRAMPFSARALKNSFGDADGYCGEKQMETWNIVVCTLIDNEYASLLFPEHFFPRCFRLLNKFVSEKKSLTRTSSSFA